VQKSDFDKLSPFFDADENWGNINIVQWYHVHHLWLIRRALVKEGRNWPMIIHCCHESVGHAKDSYHYKGVATDFHFENTKGSTLQNQLEWLLTAMINCGLDQFMGLGVYPEWHPVGGFHLDSRGSSVRWIRIGNTYHYGTDEISRYFSYNIV
jgi:hypothetical protein